MTIRITALHTDLQGVAGGLEQRELLQSAARGVNVPRAHLQARHRLENQGSTRVHTAVIGMENLRDEAPASPPQRTHQQQHALSTSKGKANCTSTRTHRGTTRPRTSSRT